MPMPIFLMFLVHAGFFSDGIAENWQCFGKQKDTSSMLRIPELDLVSNLFSHCQIGLEWQCGLGPLYKPFLLRSAAFLVGTNTVLDRRLSCLSTAKYEQPHRVPFQASTNVISVKFGCFRPPRAAREPLPCPSSAAGTVSGAPTESGALKLRQQMTALRAFPKRAKIRYVA